MIGGRILLLSLVLGPVWAQGQPEDYGRSSNFRKWARGLYRPNKEAIQWSSDEKHIWFSRRVDPNGRTYSKMDTTSGNVSPLFDHEALTAKLKELGVTRIAPHRLPILRMFSREDGVHALTRRPLALWHIDGKKIERCAWSVVPEVLLKPLTRRRRTRNGGTTSFIVVRNESPEPIELQWVDSDGKLHGYGTIKTNEEVLQHTFAGHVWSVRRANRELARYQAKAAPSVILFKTAKPIARRRTQNNRRVSPDGRYRIELTNQKIELVHTSKKTRSTLTMAGWERDAFKRVWWSPDSRWAIVRQTQQLDERIVSIVESSPRDQVQPKLHQFPYRKPGDAVPQSRLWRVDARKGTVAEVPSDLFRNQWSLWDFRWRSDSSEFSFMFNARGHQTLRLLALNAETMAVRTVIAESSKTFIDYAGKYSLYNLDSTNLLWMTERDGHNHLVRYNYDTGKVINAVTKGDWVVRSVERVGDGHVWFWAGGIVKGQDPYYLHLCRVRLDGKGLAVLTGGDGTHEVIFSPSGETFVDIWSRVDQPPRRVLRNARTGKRIAEIDQGDMSALIKAGWQVPQRFVAPGRDGKTPIYGVIFRPTTFDTAKRYPVIEQIYAGPHGAHVPKAFRPAHSSQAMAELGFIVVQIDGMGTSHRSKAFHDVTWKNLGDAGLPDRIAWIRAAAKKHPEMDLTRVGIYGGSAGGQNALGAILQYPEFYKVASADCGCHDNRMDKIWWNELWMGWPVGPHYQEQSNVTLAPKLKGKLQLIVGELDRNVDPASTMQVVDALVRANKDFELIFLPGVGHGAVAAPYGWRRMCDFFVRNLLGVEPRR